jgi:hemoglobin
LSRCRSISTAVIASQRFIDAFYAGVLDDTLLAPLFLEVAGIDLAEHLPHIRAYWCKMLLGEPGYSRHMMARHRALDGKVKLTGPHYRRWLQLFEETLRETGFRAPAEHARDLARRIVRQHATESGTAPCIQASLRTGYRESA